MDVKNTLSEKVALVTGASSGIGKAAAKYLAYAGARVGLLSRSADTLHTVAAEIQENGGEALSIPTDVANADAVQKAVDQLVQAWGRLDIVFANAGINGVWAPLEELTPEEWDKTININLRGTYLTVRSAAPHLKKRGGSVIITSSINGTRIFSNTGATAYSCTKAAQIAFMKMVCLEFAPFNIRVNAICPGEIETAINEKTTYRNLEKIRFPVEWPKGQIPLKHGEAGTAGQVAQLVWFLASDASSHITGTEMYIDGGQSLVQG